MEKHIGAMEAEVVEGNVAPGTAADVLLKKFIHIIST